MFFHSLLPFPVVLSVVLIVTIVFSVTDPVLAALAIAVVEEGE